MTLMRPDPTFYPSPGMAMQAPPERLAYVALLNAGKNGKRDTMGVIDLDPSSVRSMGGSSGKRIFHAAIMSCTTSAGMPAARVFVRRPRIRTWSAAT